MATATTTYADKDAVIDACAAGKVSADEAKTICKAFDMAASAKSMKIWTSRKGVVCVSGIGRNPAPFYVSQWLKLLAYVPTIQKYLDDNVGKDVKGTDDKGDFIVRLSATK